MRQVVKDRLARLDDRIKQLQDSYASATKESFKKNYLYEIERLCEKKEEITNHAIFGTINMSKYQFGLQERQMNYNNSVEEQKEIADAIALELLESVVNVNRIKHLKAKLGNCNRIIAIYRSSLDNWIAKGNRVTAEPPRSAAGYKEEKRIPAGETLADPEVLKAIESNYLNGVSGKAKSNNICAAENKADWTMLVRPTASE